MPLQSKSNLNIWNTSLTPALVVVVRQFLHLVRGDEAECVHRGGRGERNIYLDIFACGGSVSHQVWAHSSSTSIDVVRDSVEFKSEGAPSLFIAERPSEYALVTFKGSSPMLYCFIPHPSALRRSKKELHPLHEKYVQLAARQ